LAGDRCGLRAATPSARRSTRTTSASGRRPPICPSAASINLGNALASGGRLDEARSAYERAIGLDLSGADLALATTDLGAALYQSGRSEEAEPLLRRAAAMPEADATASFNLGAFLYQSALAEVRQNRPLAAAPLVAESVSELERTVRLDPHHAGPGFLLGHGRRRPGRSTARAAWRRAVEIDRDETNAGREAADALPARTEPESPRVSPDRRDRTPGRSFRIDLSRRLIACRARDGHDPDRRCSARSRSPRGRGAALFALSRSGSPKDTTSSLGRFRLPSMHSGAKPARASRAVLTLNQRMAQLSAEVDRRLTDVGGEVDAGSSRRAA
jgi:tetratricopeptide (TPR) repeat protein